MARKTVEEQLLARKKDIESAYLGMGSQLGVPPINISPAPLANVRIQCLDEVKKIEQDLNAEVTPTQIQNNLHRRFQEFEDPCWPCAWDYFKAREHLLSIGRVLDSVYNFDPHFSTDADFLSSVDTATLREIQAAKLKAQDVMNTCGINTKDVQSLLDVATKDIENVDHDKFRKTRTLISGAWLAAVNRLLPDLPLVLEPKSVARWEERDDLTNREVQQELAKMRESEISHSKTMPRGAKTHKCPMCEAVLAASALDEHIETRHKKTRYGEPLQTGPSSQLPMERVPFKKQPAPVKGFPMKYGFDLSVQNIGDRLAKLPLSQAKEAISKLPMDNLMKTIQYLNVAYPPYNFGWLVPNELKVTPEMFGFVMGTNESIPASQMGDVIYNMRTSEAKALFAALPDKLQEETLTYLDKQHKPSDFSWLRG